MQRLQGACEVPLDVLTCSSAAAAVPRIILLLCTGSHTRRAWQVSPSLGCVVSAYIASAIMLAAVEILGARERGIRHHHHNCPNVSLGSVVIVQPHRQARALPSMFHTRSMRSCGAQAECPARWGADGRWQAVHSWRKPIVVEWNAAAFALTMHRTAKRTVSAPSFAPVFNTCTVEL